MVNTHRKIKKKQASAERRRQSGIGTLDRKPHFYKIILSANQQNELRIPCKFAENHGNDLSSRVRLRIPNGTVWEVELVKSGDGVWLRRGWEEFTRAFSIGCGHFLLFRYDGNSYFHVVIFDMSAVEIEYPLVGRTNLEFPKEGLEEELAEEVQVGGGGKPSVATEGLNCSDLDKNSDVEFIGIRAEKVNGGSDGESLEILEHLPVGRSPGMSTVEVMRDDTYDDASIEIVEVLPPPPALGKRKGRKRTNTR